MRGAPPPPQKQHDVIRGGWNLILANSSPMAGSHQDNGGSKEPRPPQPPLAVRAHGVRDAHLLVVEVHQHTCQLVRQLLTSSKLKDHSFLRPLSMWYILVLSGLQAIPFETHTSVTFRVSVCVTGEGGRGGSMRWWWACVHVNVCTCVYMFVCIIYVYLCMCVCVHELAYLCKWAP